jgi:hypothetical protein
MTFSMVCGFYQSMQRIFENAVPAFRSFVSSKDVLRDRLCAQFSEQKYGMRQLDNESSFGFNT